MFDLKAMGDMMKLMGQAGKLKEKIAEAQTRARNRTVTGEAGAGMVKVTANGVGDVLSVQIEPEVLADVDAVGPLIVAATNVALAKSKEVLIEESQTALGGIELPPGIV